MCVYNDVEGWQNYQFWGSGEFALAFGNYEVNLTVPADHVVDATGKLKNIKEVYSKKMMRDARKQKIKYLLGFFHSARLRERKYLFTVIPGV